MSWIKTRVLSFAFIIFSSAILFLVIDFTFGGYFLPCAKRGHLKYASCEGRAPRISHPVYDHGFKTGFRGVDDWGGKEYEFCTDDNGFKVSCLQASKGERYFDIAFIGDSFTEGIGLPYEMTFVGQIASQLPRLRIANLGVASYSPSIYLAKVRHLLDSGIYFRELVVFIDISDIQDEGVSYFYEGDTVYRKGEIKAERIVKRYFSWAFPVTFEGLKAAQSLTSGWLIPATKEQGGIGINYDTRGKWTYDESADGYGGGGVNAAIAQALDAMGKLHRLTESRGIKLSIGVYPWPSQLLYDTVNSRQVAEWKAFCEGRCIHFFNSFDSFFSLKEKMGVDQLITGYFIAGDVHHNIKGAEVIAKDVLEFYKSDAR